MDEYRLALKTSNEYIAQVCFDQMVDIRLMEFLREKFRFKNVMMLKSNVQGRLREELKPLDIGAPRFNESFDRAWAKFPPKKGYRPFSVKKEQLVEPRRKVPKEVGAKEVDRTQR